MNSVDSKRPLTILHTNDFHNHLSAGSGAQIARIVAATAEPNLLVDAGDAGGSSNVTFRTAGEPILEEMSRLGYCAMTVGNRDFHVSRLGFRSKLFKARFPVLCANVRPSGTVIRSPSLTLSARWPDRTQQMNRSCDPTSFGTPANGRYW